MKNATAAADTAPTVKCRVCMRELVRAQGMWAHAVPQQHHPHLAEPRPADLRRFRDWTRR